MFDESGKLKERLVALRHRCKGCPVSHAFWRCRAARKQLTQLNIMVLTRTKISKSHSVTHPPSSLRRLDSFRCARRNLLCWSTRSRNSQLCRCWTRNNFAMPSVVTGKDMQWDNAFPMSHAQFTEPSWFSRLSKLGKWCQWFIFIRFYCFVALRKTQCTFYTA